MCQKSNYLLGITECLLIHKGDQQQIMYVNKVIQNCNTRFIHIYMHVLFLCNIVDTLYCLEYTTLCKYKLL